MNKIFNLKLINKVCFFILFCFFAFVSYAQGPLPSAPVVVSEVIEEKLQKPITYVGTVEPFRRSVVASEIEGIVSSFAVNDGDYVNKGDLIAELRTDMTNIRLQEAKGSKREVNARSNLAVQDLEKIKKLHEKGIASLQQLQDAESEKDAWSGRKSLIQAQIDMREYDLKVSKIVAPFNGYITKESTQIGEWLDKGGPVVELVDIDKTEIKVDIPEQYIDDIEKGDSVTIKFDAFPEGQIQGEITSIVPQADSAARTFPVKIEIDNQDHRIKSGMLARVSFLVGSPKLVKLVPKDAIVEQNKNYFIYLVNNGSAQPVPVDRGLSYKELIEIIGPVETGQLVVIRGNERLQPGQPVQIINSDNGVKTE